MNYRPTAKDFNALFRGKIYGNHDIFTARSYADLIRRHDIDLSRAISTFEDGQLVGTIAFAQRGERAWLSLMGVQPEQRRRGHGKRLFGAAVEAVRAAGARSIEFEVVQRNTHAVAMYSGFGFKIVDELLVWARKSVPSAREDLVFRRYGESAVARIARKPATCWQREPRSVARGGNIALVRCDGAYAFVRMRDDNAVLLDAGAVDDAKAGALLTQLERRIPQDITLVNEPAGSALSRAFARAGWRIANRQHRMVGA